LSQESVAGAAAYEAIQGMKDRASERGQPDNQALAKELLAGLAGAAVDRLIEIITAASASVYMVSRDHC